MRRIIGAAALWYFKASRSLREWLNRRGEQIHRQLVWLAFLLLWLANFAAPQAISPQDLETLRQQWEQRQRSEFWSNVVEFILAGMLSWIVWLLRAHWIEVLTTLWKYVKVSFRVPIEIVDMKTANANTREELLKGQQEIIARQTLLAARINILEDHGAVASFVADVDGAWTSITREMADIIGDHPGDLLGYRWKVRIEEGDRERVMTAWMKSVKYREPFSADFHFISTTGKRGKVRMIAYQQIGPLGNSVGYVGQVFKIPGTGEVPPLPSY